jgi:hypothetical protein
MKSLALLFALALVALAASCGAGKTNCDGTFAGIAITPMTATADHSAAKPGNQATFIAFAQYNYSGGCAIPAALQVLTAQWTVSDTTDVTIANTPSDQVPGGIATCLSAVTPPVTVKAAATLPTGLPAGTFTATAQLTCK